MFTGTGSPLTAVNRLQNRLVKGGSELVWAQLCNLCFDVFTLFYSARVSGGETCIPDQMDRHKEPMVNGGRRTMRG